MDTQFVLLTAAKNEERYIEHAIRSVVRQTIHPLAWYIVDDGSIDRTAEIIRDYSKTHPFIRLVSREGGQQRSFGAQYRAINMAYELAKDLNFDFIGVQDADIEVESIDYYGQVLEAFSRDPLLGVAGGYIYERRGGHWLARPANSPDAVAGGIQMFRRACFEQIGGYSPLIFGGEDWLAQIEAKRAGWAVYALPDLTAYHYRPTSSADGRLKGLFRLGLMDASFGSHPLFEVFKCVRHASPNIRLYLGPWFATLVIFGGGFPADLPFFPPKNQPFCAESNSPSLIQYWQKSQMSVIDTSFKGFCRILEMAEDRFKWGDAESSVALAQIAARLAYPANAGLFASPRLERLLVSIGKSLSSPMKAQAIESDAGRRQRVLHVLSYARPVGGDTRFVWRWIQEDLASTHFVVVTTQADVSKIYEPPRALEEAIKKTGGTLRFLQVPPSRPLDQALELRHLFQGADIVALASLSLRCDTDSRTMQGLRRHPDDIS